MLEDFNKECIIVDHVHREAMAGDYPDACEAVLSRDIIVVEPAHAAYVLKSARHDAPPSVEISEETIMAGLACGEVSRIAWEILSPGASDLLAISEHGIEEAMRLMASGKTGGGNIVVGKSAAPGLVALIGAATTDTWRLKLGLDRNSRVLLIGSEGATDPWIYQRIVGVASDDVCAGEGHGR